MAWSRTVATRWAFASILVGAACKPSPPAAALVARVNGEGITRGQFDELVSRNLRRYSSQTAALPEGIRTRIEEGVLRRMIDDCAVSQEARKQGVGVTDKELDAHFQEHKQRFRSPQAFGDYLARSDTTEAALREDLKKSLLRDRLVDKLTGAIAVDDADVARYYSENEGHFTEATQMHVRRLLLRAPSDAGAAALRHIGAEARHLREEAKRHPHSFASLCKRHSQGPEAEQEGSMGVVGAGRMPELDRLMAEGLEAEAISPVVQTAQGLEIYQVSDVQPQHQRPLAQMTGSIREALTMRRRNDRRQEVLRSLKDNARVEMLITFAPPTPPGVPSPAPAVPPTP